MNRGRGGEEEDSPRVYICAGYWCNESVYLGVRPLSKASAMPRAFGGVEGGRGWREG